MKVALEVLTKLYEDWTDFEDFYVFFQVNIVFVNHTSGIETFSFAVVSPKRLASIVSKK